jgi:2-furoyl-CoA dehydrogenase large subunit
MGTAEMTAAWVGRSVERVEDAALLTGRGRYLDDLGTRPDTLHAAILRAPHAHARIRALDVEAARAAPGVAGVLTGAEVTALSVSLVVGVRAQVQCWPIAVDRVRYVGEPVAVAATSPATARSATAIRTRRLQWLRGASPCALTIRAIPAPRSRPTAWSPTILPARTPTT